MPRRGFERSGDNVQVALVEPIASCGSTVVQSRTGKSCYESVSYHESHRDAVTPITTYWQKEEYDVRARWCYFRMRDNPGFPDNRGSSCVVAFHKEYIKDQVPANRLRKLEKDVAVRKLEIAHMEDDIEALRTP